MRGHYLGDYHPGPYHRMSPEGFPAILLSLAMLLGVASLFADLPADAIACVFLFGSISAFVVYTITTAYLAAPEDHDDPELETWIDEIGPARDK